LYNNSYIQHYNHTVTGSQATLLAASATPRQVQAGRPGIHAAAGPNPAVPGGGMPAHRPGRWAQALTNEI